MRFTTSAIFAVMVFAAVAILAAPPAGPRAAITVGQVTIGPKDSLAVVPVYLSNPVDSIAGVEFVLSIPENKRIHFAADEGNPGQLPLAVDTAGTLVSGWEWIAVGSPSKNVYDIKVAALADWPDNKRTPPLAPQKNGVLVKMVLRVDTSVPLMADTLFPITIVANKSGFSDPRGSSIGVVTKSTQKCDQYVGDSCVSWRTVRTASIDTTVAKFKGGSVRIATVAAGGKK